LSECDLGGQVQRVSLSALMTCGGSAENDEIVDPARACAVKIILDRLLELHLSVNTAIRRDRQFSARVLKSDISDEYELGIAVEQDDEIREAFLLELELRNASLLAFRRKLHLLLLLRWRVLAVNGVTAKRIRRWK